MVPSRASLLSAQEETCIGIHANGLCAAMPSEAVEMQWLRRALSPSTDRSGPFSATEHPYPAEPAQPHALCTSNRFFSEVLGIMTLLCRCRLPAGF